MEKGCVTISGTRKAMVTLSKRISTNQIRYLTVEGTTLRVSYDSFRKRKWRDDYLISPDLRWLSLLLMVLAFAALLKSSLHATRDNQQTSVCRKAIAQAPGGSPDPVQAGSLVSRYRIYLGRTTESWLTSSFTIGMAQSQ
ncbi:hypothetical protein LLEC1_01853 [Akanthomyces lecanii]|uniref:Uncharacterized protein n=1 Tax=Cordyceps confragosa TaxID=2714763 RepID=A0A179I0T2_CORDF|nr:hypothetical protein LLEC1_01853 [Akanthomyces lecanii]